MTQNFESIRSRNEYKNEVGFEILFVRVRKFQLKFFTISQIELIERNNSEFYSLKIFNISESRKVVFFFFF